MIICVFICAVIVGNPGPCSNNPCQNGGSCSARGNDYVCQCPASYTGKNCQSGSLFIEVFCLSSMHPINNIWTLLRKNTISIEYFNVDNIAVVVSTVPACDSAPCQHGGTCSDSGNGSYTCTCNSAMYTGANCETGEHVVLCSFPNNNQPLSMLIYHKSVFGVLCSSG